MGRKMAQRANPPNTAAGPGTSRSGRSAARGVCVHGASASDPLPRQLASGAPRHEWALDPKSTSKFYNEAHYSTSTCSMSAITVQSAFKERHNVGGKALNEAKVRPMGFWSLIYAGCCRCLTQTRMNNKPVQGERTVGYRGRRVTGGQVMKPGMNPAENLSGSPKIPAAPAYAM